MTARPNLGGSQRQPQRSLSANLIQRPQPNPSRSLSQQYPPLSPVRRNNEGFTELAFDGSDAGGRHANMARNGGSRLKLEISKDSKNLDFVESPKATLESTPTWRPSLPPRGRPQLHFDVPSISNFSPQEGAQMEAPVKSMPLPVRPGHHAHAPDKARVVSGYSLKKDARPKPYVLEVPTAAPHYSPNGHADFFPWTGNHLEDQFSEAAIRQGFYDKSQMTQNETGSARTSIFPSLKHKSGLQTLSSLFTSVLAQRRAYGQITTNSTFKPPPRVTVTDTKREMWLKDLANPTISLRRLSRSIPHGIRGKVLLDQSLGKNIPIERAVWLAKCVGANELRSFRRKGASGFPMGGEGKWIREFTVCVEQFLENVVGSCGETDFKGRINYAIRLSAHFHAEHLLDREHYMDWLVSSLENTPQAKLPMWLLITQIYWKDILKYRKFGRRLSAALLKQWAEIRAHPDNDILVSLSDRISHLLKGLIASYPESMISSTVWTQHRSVLETLSLGDSRLALLFSSIDQRNRRLATLGIGREPDSRKSLIRILDLTLTNPFTSELLEQCWLLDEDKNMLIQAVLEWATSFHRPGTAKIYTAARLLRHWSKSGVDVTLAILGFLDSKFEIGRSKPAFYHLVSELVRSEHFSIPIYIQWMIARGGLSEAEDVAPDGPSATRLLVELPTHNLTESMSALRDTLLSRAGYSIRNEGAQIRACMVFLNTLLPNMQANMDLELDSDIAMTESPMDMLPTLSRGKKSEIGLWLRQKVGLQMLQPPIPPLDDWDDSPIKGGTSAITIKDFNILRQTLELMDDHSILADLLRMVSSSSDADVLALCADTVNLHLDSFSAIGALKSLFETLMTRLRCLTDDESFPRILLVSLSDLAHRVPGQKDVARQLIQELLRSDRKTAAEACSPASDHMTGVAQTAESDFTDEIERVLASGNSMDQATLERLFHRIAIHSESAWEKSPELYRNYIMLFTRLRTFDTSQFDILMAGWVKRLLRMETRPSMVQVFGPLISFGCVALRDVISSCASIAETEPTLSEPVLARLSEEVLVLLMGPSKVPHAMAEVDTYRLRIQQSHMQRDYPSETLGVVRQIVKNTLSLNGSKMQHSRPEVQDLLDSHEMLEIFQRLVLTDANSVIQKLVVPLHESANFGSVGAISRMIDKLLTGKKDVEADQRIPFELVLNLANDFTLPFCQVKLALMFISDQATAMAIDEQNSERLQEFDHAIESAIAAENTTWTCIVPSLDVSVAQHLRKRAESQFISIFQSLKTTSVDDMSTMHTRIKEATSLLYIVDATAYTLQTSPATSSLASEIIAVLNNMWLVFCTTQTQNSGVKEATMTKWLPLLLAFVTIQASAFDISRSGLENRSRLLLALTAILLELQAVDTSTEALNTVIEQAFDLALYLVDVLPDDLRHHCVRSLRDTISNRRVSYVFSVVKNPSEWLLLSQRDKAGMSGLVEGRGFGIEKEKLTAYPLRRWEMLGEPTPNVGENDTSLSLTLFGARRG